MTADHGTRCRKRDEALKDDRYRLIFVSLVKQFERGRARCGDGRQIRSREEQRLTTIALFTTALYALPNPQNLSPREEKCSTQCCHKWTSICQMSCSAGLEHAICLSK